MRYITIKNTDIKVSRLAFGTASLHHIFSRKKRLNLLEDALMLGISHFDTSPYYGYGLSEIDLGLMSKGRRDHVSITTKIGSKWGLHLENTYASSSFYKGISIFSCY